MKNISLPRLSILGIVLMGASAVTAAILPNKSAAKPLDADGSLTLANTLDGAAVFTCTLTAGTIGARCNVTAGSLTTVGIANNSWVGEFQTANNTTTV